MGFAIAAAGLLGEVALSMALGSEIGGIVEGLDARMRLELPVGSRAVVFAGALTGMREKSALEAGVSGQMVATGTWTTEEGKL